MNRIFGRSPPASLLDQFLQRRRAHRRDVAPAPGGDQCARNALAEMIAAAAVLDFGAFSFEAMILKGGRRLPDEDA
ncbi:MAG TPA: hypothetical protein VKW08_04825 [Xanthobacteraceae bacterium]|nr:hypothetical protein [Xanthobacteraceae bacterium]